MSLEREFEHTLCIYTLLSYSAPSSSSTQCENRKNLLSEFLWKNFVKSTEPELNHVVSCFHEIFLTIKSKILVFPPRVTLLLWFACDIVNLWGYMKGSAQRGSPSNKTTSSFYQKLLLYSRWHLLEIDWLKPFMK